MAYPQPAIRSLPQFAVVTVAGWLLNALPQPYMQTRRPGRQIRPVQ